MNNSKYWLVGAFLMLAVMNGWSTVAVVRDSVLTRKQKGLQLLLIWGLPFLGAIIVLAVRHFASRQSGKLPGDSSLVVEDRHYISKGYFF